MTCSIQYVIQYYNKMCILSTFEKKKRFFALSNRRFNNLSNDTKFIKIEVILLKVQFFSNLLFSLYYFTHYFVHYLRINLADKIM